MTHGHRVALGLFAGLTALLLVFWMAPRALLMVFGVALLALAYAAIYLVVIAWLDPKGPVRAQAQLPTPAAHDTRVTPLRKAPGARKRTSHKRKAGR